MVIVSQGWPSALIPVLAFDLPLAGVFFPSSFHQYFTPPASKPRIKWLPIESFRDSAIKGTAFYLVTGDLEFIRRIVPLLPEPGRIIVGIEMPLRSSHPKFDNFLSRARSKAIRYLKNQVHLTAATLRDAKFGGATDASFVFGFGNQLHGLSVPSEVPHVGYVLRHYLDGGTKGWFDRCRSEDLPVLPDDTEHVIWGDSQLPITHRVKFGQNPNGDRDHLSAGIAGPFIRQEGLFPCNNPLVSVACPCYFAKGKLSLRSLTVPELLRLYQLPLDMDGFFQQFKMSSALPFEQAASPVIYTSIFRQLWGVDGGGFEWKFTSA